MLPLICLFSLQMLLALNGHILLFQQSNLFTKEIPRKITKTSLMPSLSKHLIDCTLKWWKQKQKHPIILRKSNSRLTLKMRQIILYHKNIFSKKWKKSACLILKRTFNLQSQTKWNLLVAQIMTRRIGFRCQLIHLLARISIASIRPSQVPNWVALLYQPNSKGILLMKTSSQLIKKFDRLQLLHRFLPHQSLNQLKQTNLILLEFPFLITTLVVLKLRALLSVTSLSLTAKLILPRIAPTQ